MDEKLLAAIRAHHAAGKPLLAECGGMLYLLDSLTDVEGTRAELVGLLKETLAFDSPFGDMVEQTQAVYAAKPDSIRRLIISSSSSGLSEFADSFRLRRD